MQKHYKGEQRGKIGLLSNVKAKRQLFFVSLPYLQWLHSTLFPGSSPTRLTGAEKEGTLATRLGFVE